MKIRLANQWDTPRIKEMLWDYHDNLQMRGLKITQEESGERVIATILAGGGMALLSEKDNYVTGMLLALTVPFIWDQTQLVMSEIALWVDPEYRRGRAGYMLLKEYTDRCEDLRQQGRLVNYTISQMEGQNFDYSRFGYKPIEHTWSL